MLYFPKSGYGIGDNNYFLDLTVSIKSLVTLLTTANFPDIMMASYIRNHSVVLFFVVFIFVGIFFLMPLILAVIYNHFQKNNREQYSKLRQRRKDSLSRAFDVLAIPVEDKKHDITAATPRTQQYLAADAYISQRQP
eukprot:UN31687